jgi:hypothetical protein
MSAMDLPVADWEQMEREFMWGDDRGEDVVR